MKGVTLIELIISISIMCIMIPLEIYIFVDLKSIYDMSLKQDMSLYRINEALSYIENEVQDNTLYVSICEDKILIHKTNGGTEYLYFFSKNENAGDIRILYHEYGKQDNVNDVIGGIHNFSFQINNKVLYVCITSKEGRYFERCVGIRTEN